jgi:prepilin-type N-terminal cleavage/methylation domain-containing protein
MNRETINEKGLTLVELMVALVIAAILMIGIFRLYRSTHDTYVGQEKLVEIQQGSRILLEQMSREMRLAGYQADCVPTLATPTAFEFEADTDLDGTPERILFLYIDDPMSPDYKTIMRAVREPAPADCNNPMASPTLEAFVTGIEEVHFDYYDANNNLLPNPVTTADTDLDGTTDLGEIQRVAIRVGAKTTDPLTGSEKTVSQTSEVRLRNTGLAESGGCTPPNNAPAGLNVVDIQVCGRVRATWSANPPSDQVTSYRLYSKLSTDATWRFVNDTPTSGTSYIKSDNLVQGGTYAFAVAARNSCGLGPLSSVFTMALPINDSVKPEPPAWLSPGATAAGEGYTVNLTWNASVTKGLAGEVFDPNDVRIYKVIRDGTIIGEVNESGAATYAFTDTVPVDQVCQIHNYTIQAEDTCANLGDPSAAASGNGSLSGADTPFNNETNTRPAESVVPGEPAGFVAVSGGRHPPDTIPATYRITLTWTNASDLDVKGTRVRYKEKNTSCGAGDYPADPTASTFLVDEPGAPSATESNYYDIFKNNKYYCFTAFQYDSCTNYSAGTTATAQAKTCGDEPLGAPNAIDLGTLKVQDRFQIDDGNTEAACDAPNENRGIADLRWTTAQNLTNTPDLAGFNVYRFPAPTTGASFVFGGETYYLITDAPFFDATGEITEFTDNHPEDGLNSCIDFGPDGASDTTVAGDDVADNDGINGGPNGICDSIANDNPVGDAEDFYVTGVAGQGSPQNAFNTKKLLPGVTYKYIVRVADCLGQESGVNQSVTLKPGKPTRDTNVNITTSGTKSGQHNIVNLGLRNTSLSDLTFRNAAAGRADTATITWTNTAARLTKIVVDGTTLWEDLSAAPTTTSGTPVTFTGIKTLSSGVNGKTMKLTFKKSDGATNIDMRGSTITVTLTHRNETVFASNANNTESTCSAPFTFTVSQGAILSNTTQDPPKDPDFLFFSVTPKKSTEAGVPPGWLVAGNDVFIETQATPQSGSSVSSVTVFYYVDGAFLPTAPDPSVTPYTSLAMTAIGGDFYQAKIPAQLAKRVWFYIEARDTKGRFSTDPNQTETSFIAYTYDPFGVSAGWNGTDCPIVDDILVKGDLKDDSGNPLSGASVAVEMVGTDGASQVINTTTGALGEFSVISDLLFKTDVTVAVEITKDAFFKACTLPPVAYVPCNYPQRLIACY